jgi:lysophospholipase L1-like esterase/predicted secreted protein
MMKKKTLLSLLCLFFVLTETINAQRVLIDIGGDPNYGGTLTTSPSLNGNFWNNMTDAREGLRLANAVTTTNVPSGINIEVVSRVDGTYNVSSLGIGNGNTVGIVGDYPASATTDHALVHSSATTGRWRVSGLNINNTYTIKFWGARSNTTATRAIEIKRYDETAWQTYNATANTNYTNAISFTFTAKSQMDFDIRTKAGSDFSAINVLDISIGGSTPAPLPVNQPPVAIVSADTTLQLPTDSLLLKGCLSYDPENALLKYKWSKISGPAAFSLPNDSLCSVKAKNLVAGFYKFELTVSDTGGLKAKDTLSVTVSNLPPPSNLSPVANAGADTTIQIPADSVQLRGCSSYDPENATLRYKWVKIAGPSSLFPTNDSVCSVKVKNMLAGLHRFELTVTDPGGLIGKDTVSVAVNAAVTTNWPPPVTALCNLPYKIVVVGSSTAYGTGSDPIDSSWVRKYKAYMLQQGQQVTLVNLATPGLTSWDVSPTGTYTPYPFTIDTARNITKALTYQPDAIILSLPSNDVGRGVPVDSIHRNYARIVALADAQHIPVWVTTTQPRNGLSASEQTLQMELRDWINTTYGNKAVDFWSTVANADGTINPFYSFGDGVHLNNYGHHVLFTRMVQENLWDSVCLRRGTNFPPMAKAGNDTTIIGNSASFNLNGTKSFDPEGGTLGFSWRLITTQGCSLSNSTSANPLFSASTIGTFMVELTVQDAAGLAGRDSILIRVVASNISPIANAGSDQVLTLPNHVATLNGSASSDPDGTIATYRWKTLTGIGSVTISDTTTVQTVIDFSSAGVYTFELKVIDNGGAISRDTVRVTVNSALNTAPVARAGADQVLTLPNHIANLNGSSSSDPDGSIITYRWRTIGGAGSSLIADSTAIQTQVDFSVAGVYNFELKVTDNAGAISRDTVAIIVNSALNTPPIAKAGTDQFLTLPNHIANLTGSGSSDPDGSITTYRWKSLSGTGSVIISDSTAVQTVADFSAAGVYTFELKVIDNGGAISRDTVVVTVNSALNSPPIAKAGTDQFLTLPNHIANLSGSASSDPDGTITTYRWRKVSGTGSVVISDSTTIQTAVDFSSAGVYNFELKVTDNAGAISRDTVSVTVSPAANTPPIAKAGADQFITLPNHIANLNGSTSSDPDGTITTYRWRRISGPGTVIISDSTTAQTSLDFSVAGLYTIELKVIDNAGAIARDSVNITINASSNQSPVANAGADKIITLPASSVLLDGRSSSDPEAAQLGFQWQLVSGPSGSQVLNPGRDTTTVNFVNAGNYTFRLTVTDGAGLSATDDINVIVQAASTTTAKKILVNIYGGVNPYTDPQWNNWDMAATASSSKFKYSDGSLSNVNASITSTGVIADNGVGYAPASTACPPQVLRYNSANTSIRTLNIMGLNSNQFYSFEFYASRANTGNSTVVSMGNSLDTISTSNNVNDYAKFINVRADASGKVSVDLSRIGTWNYLAGFQVTEQAATMLAREGWQSKLLENNLESGQDEVSFYPNPARDFVTVNLPGSMKGKYLIELSDATGIIVQKTIGSKIPGVNTANINIRNLNKGVYFLNLTYGNKASTHKIIKL